MFSIIPLRNKVAKYQISLNSLDLSFYKIPTYWEFPGGPVVRTWCFHCHGPGSIPGQGTPAIHTTRPKKRYQFISGILTSSGTFHWWVQVWGKPPNNQLEPFPGAQASTLNLSLYLLKHLSIHSTNVYSVFIRYLTIFSVLERQHWIKQVKFPGFLESTSDGREEKTINK